MSSARDCSFTRGWQIAGRFTLISTLAFPFAAGMAGPGRHAGGRAAAAPALTVTLAGLDRYLHQRTGGMIGSLSHLIRGAAIEAILDGSEQITRKLLDTIEARPRRRERSACSPSLGRHDTPPPSGDGGSPGLLPGPAPARDRESTPGSYIRRLARANHLRPAYLRRYLASPNDGTIRTELLAVMSGRTS